MSNDNNGGFGQSEAYDIIEGVVAGGLIGFTTFVVSTAVSLFPASFITAAMVSPLSVITGALGFLGFAVHNIRKRRGL